MEFAKSDIPVRYLGIPLAAKWLSITDYSPLVDQIAGCIGKWTSKSLSFTGRLELIRSVIQGVECFWLQVFPLPVAVIEKIHHLCRVFLWNSRRAPVAVHPRRRFFGIQILDVLSLSFNIHRKTDTLWVNGQ
ncbi:hypothetical protein Sango_2287200 [Sesamum angolense]|uniref:Uncharacterized protein n=1 Tax=Sesamum angolense TaxID=2727404 RepID=A0AAE1WA03_9LAMI|nr:hypothetical protein Sango_2287200 [Sesamum angolense]